MAPSASKQKRLAEKAAKASAKAAANGSSITTTATTPSSPATSVNGGSTPLTSLSAAGSREDLSEMAKLQIATDRCVFFSNYARD